MTCAFIWIACAWDDALQFHRKTTRLFLGYYSKCLWNGAMMRHWNYRAYRTRTETIENLNIVWRFWHVKSVQRLWMGSSTFPIVGRWNINLMRRHRNHPQSWLQWLVRDAQWWWWRWRWSLPVHMFLSVNLRSSVLKRKLNWNEYHKILRCTREQSTATYPEPHAFTHTRTTPSRPSYRCALRAYVRTRNFIYIYINLYMPSLSLSRSLHPSPSLTNSVAARKIIECIRLPYNLI